MAVCFNRAKLAAASLVGIWLLSGPATASDVINCFIPPELSRFEFPLRRIADRLGSSDPIVIVALGSSSTAGAGASSSAKAYPGRLASELARIFPSERIVVLNRGVNGERAVDMLARFDKSVSVEHADLVIWQLGSNAVLRGFEPSNFLIREGIRQIKSIGADVVLIDPQYAPKLLAKPQLEEMVDLIAFTAQHERVHLFRRFALMRHWHDVEGTPFEAFLSGDGLHMNDWSYDCLAKGLAGAIAEAGIRGRNRTTNIQ
jgi:acyl-CoA thioesterase-1